MEKRETISTKVRKLIKLTLIVWINGELRIGLSLYNG